MAFNIEWILLVAAIFAVGFYAYNTGYRSGKDRALRDNANDLKDKK